MKRSTVMGLAVAALLATAARADDAVPRFSYLPPGFVPVGVVTMDDYWHAFGYPESGFNYYTYAGPADPSSPYAERFDPLAPAYQVFAGAYVVRDFQFSSEWEKPDLRPGDIRRTVERAIGLAVADYYAWNTAYGAPPATTVLPGFPVVVKARDGWFHLVSVVSTYSDLGAAEPWFPWVPPYGLYQDVVAPYQPVTIVADQMIKWDPVHRNLLVVYSNAVHYRLKDGSVRHTPLWTAVELARTMAGVGWE